MSESGRDFGLQPNAGQFRRCHLERSMEWNCLGSSSTNSQLFGKVFLQDDPQEQRRHFSGIQIRVDSKPSHSVYECSSADTQSDCSAIRTAYAALACGKRLYDLLALLPFVLLSAGVDIRS